MFIPFNKISDNYRCWIYQTHQRIGSFEKKFICKKLEDFCEKWNTHNVPVKSSFITEFDYYIILFAESTQTNISGCAIDKQRKIIGKIAEELKIEISSYINTGVFLEKKLIFLSKKEILYKIKKNEINSETKIINVTVKNKKEYEKKWILKIKESWMKNFLVQNHHIQ